MLQIGLQFLHHSPTHLFFIFVCEGVATCVVDHAFSTCPPPPHAHDMVEKQFDPTNIQCNCHDVGRLVFKT